MHLAQALTRTAARLPDKPALRHEGSDVTYAELDQAVDRAAATLAGLGLAPGARVALLLPNQPAFVITLYGAWRAGLVAVPLNTASTAREVGQILADAQASAVVVDTAHQAVAGEAAPANVRVVAADTLVSSDPDRLPVRSDDLPSPAPEGRLDDGDLALLQYTAGTAGRPKGALLTHRHLATNHDQLAGSRQEIAERDLVLAVLPLFHIYGLNVCLAFALRRGATVLLVDRSGPEELLDLVARERVSVVLGVPTMYAAWLALADAPDLGSVRIATSGAAPLPAAVLAAFRERFAIGIWEGYGLTETSPVLTTTAMGDAPRPGSVGRPLPRVELRLVDDRGRPVAAGDPGEVWARGPNVFDGYWRDEQATAAAFAADSWFRTGDIGFVDDGWLYLVDRRSDLVIVSGFNVYPREVEEVLVAHPDVAQAAVVGVPDARTGETVKAVIVLREGASAAPEELGAHCRRWLARFKCPSTIEVTAELPQLAAGKLLRRALRDPDAEEGAHDR